MMISRQFQLILSLSLNSCYICMYIWFTQYYNYYRTEVIIIIIMSRHQHGYPWPSLAISPYHSSPPAGLQGYILCPHIVAVCKFVLVVLLLHIHMWGSHRSTSVMSSSLLLQQCPACLVRLTCIVFVMRGQVSVQLESRGVLSPGLV